MLAIRGSIVLTLSQAGESMRLISAPMFMLLAPLFACQNGVKVSAGDTAGLGMDSADESADDTAGDTADSDWREYDGATMVILSPASGDFLPWSEDSTFAAEIHAADGTVMDFDAITWSSDVDAAWTVSGQNIVDNMLDVGTHALTATANLPNGDRLAYTIGGVLVQSPYAGIYTGTLVIDASYDSYALGCSGATTLTVDAYGETVTGDAGCLLSLGGYDIDTAYIFDYANDAGVLSGSSSIDLGFYQYEIDTEGSMDTDGNLEAEFTTDIAGFGIAGTLTATRVTRDLSGM